MVGAQREYGGFFAAVDRGALDDEGVTRLEADVGAGGANAYLALSSLAYGYYQLALRAAADPKADPAVRARLERWNDLMAAAYQARPDDEPFRQAVREAAQDLHRRAPAVALSCLDAVGQATACDSTEALLRALDRGRDAAGVRGAVGRLIERAFGEEAP